MNADVNVSSVSTSIQTWHSLQEAADSKLRIIKDIEQQISKKLDLYEAKSLPEEKEYSYYFYNSLCTKALYMVFLFFGFFEKSIGSFLFGSTFFALIPGVSPSILWGISIIYTILDAILFYAFEVSFLQKMMGLPVVNPSTLLNETYLAQLKAVRSINEMLRDKSAYRLDPEEYKNFCTFRDLCNEDLCALEASLGSYPKSWCKLFLEYFIMIYGAISSMADSYFMAKAAILGLHLSLASSLGIVIALAMVLSGLGFYYAMGAKSVSKLVNPDRKSFNLLQKNLNSFKESLPKKRAPNDEAVEADDHAAYTFEYW